MTEADLRARAEEAVRQGHVGEARSGFEQLLAAKPSAATAGAILRHRAALAPLGDARPVRVAFLRSFTLEPVLPLLAQPTRGRVGDAAVREDDHRCEALLRQALTGRLPFPPATGRHQHHVDPGRRVGRGPHEHPARRCDEHTGHERHRLEHPPRSSTASTRGAAAARSARAARVVTLGLVVPFSGGLVVVNGSVGFRVASFGLLGEWLGLVVGVLVGHRSPHATSSASTLGAVTRGGRRGQAATAPTVALGATATSRRAVS
jgi:hypothetical protein